ncbi:TetR family transcriptional regulator [Sneathiella limimaris]|uniref:TetR family transcriptional regulator n=1 Tax=Sneathiella limimaris TaxID=1964213 RepID=UPI00146A42FB
MKEPQKRRLDTRKKILDVAREIVLQDGYEALRTEEVVKKAGVAKGTLFAHFGDKDQLLYTLMCEEFDGAVGTVVREMSKQDFMPEDFVTSLVPFLKLLSRERILFDLFQHFAGVTVDQFSLEVGDDCHEFQDLLANAIKRLQTDSKIRTDLPETALGEGCLAFLVQAVSFKLSGQYSSLDEAEKEFRFKLKSWLS